MPHFEAPLEVDVRLPSGDAEHRVTAAIRLVARDRAQAEEILNTLLRPLGGMPNIAVGMPFTVQEIPERSVQDLTRETKGSVVAEWNARTSVYPKGTNHGYLGGHEERVGREAMYDLEGDPDESRLAWQTRGRGWEGAGPYAGRGPRGYRRSDERIRHEACEALTDHGGVDASEIEVEVQNGEVTLRGTVDGRRQKRLAEDAVDRIAGVRDVHNQLRVVSGVSVPTSGPGQLPDMDGMEPVRSATRNAVRR